MKKLLLVCVTVAASLLFSNNAQSQVKIGYFDEQTLLSLFPGIDKVDTLMNSYVRDSLNVEYQYSVVEYQRRDSLFKKDSATMPAKAREMAVGELNRLYYKIANWQQYAQEMQQDKMDRLLLPYRQQMVAALQQVVAENKYTLVLKAEAISPYIDPSLSILDNLTIRTAIKLKLELPKEWTDAWKAAGGTVPGATGAKPPAPKPKQ
ncbi:OmpH family outer membrane protein [Sediminibacterium sp.]|jgi:Skp family chaperone for outer membrane proteins|uniref:OmpH family outer membrane protein n=1 Tax=Sediminibacterium sp. TaxID=1917865 RepID=UPI0025D13E72|nr:OmpH family outer membrane protein [Sediminibacterium sp.]MBW0179152.1 OmpH family outer membrane protein [Sediminibacterium sp.]